MTNLKYILKSRDITLSIKVHIVKVMVFLVVVYGCESWTIKKAEHQRIGTFEMWCWRRFLRIPWKSKEIKPVNSKGNQTWIFIGRTDAEAPILCPLDAKNWLIGKDPDAEKDWGQEEKGERQRVGWFDGIIDSMDLSLSKPQEIVKDRDFWWATVYQKIQMPVRGDSSQWDQNTQVNSHIFTHSAVFPLSINLSPDSFPLN